MQFLGTNKLSSTLGSQQKGGNCSTLPCLEKKSEYSSTDHITSVVYVLVLLYKSS